MRQFEVGKLAASTTLVGKEIAAKLNISLRATTEHLIKVYRHFGLSGTGCRLRLITIYSESRYRWRDYPAFVRWRNGSSGQSN
jgi:hypothetical protein